jgi:hypothetical protein
VALLLILFALFGFVFAGIGSGSTGSGTAQAPAVPKRSAPSAAARAPVVRASRPARSPLRAKNTSCVVTSWEQGASGASFQQRPCRRSPAKP